MPSKAKIPQQRGFLLAPAVGQGRGVYYQENLQDAKI